MIWGGIGGVIGFIVSLFGSFAGIVAAIFVGLSCGRRAGAAGEPNSGAMSGLKSGALAAPLFAMGAAAGAVVAAQQIGSSEIAATLSEVLNVEVSNDEAWNLYLIGTAVAAVIQVSLLIGVSAAAAAWVARKRPSS
ncbi:conserved hypothetical protein [Rubrobacter radiotolerans DSM 5868]|nr:conserved hypothetical protein [Rubrobacter radiotolerans DSM 5868]